MATIKTEVSTNETEENTVYIHNVEQQEGKSLVDTMLEAVEASMLLYNAEGIRSISLYIEE